MMVGAVLVINTAIIILTQDVQIALVGVLNVQDLIGNNVLPVPLVLTLLVEIQPLVDVQELQELMNLNVIQIIGLSQIIVFMIL